MLAIRILILGVALLISSKVDGIKLLFSQYMQASCTGNPLFYEHIQVMDACTFIEVKGTYYYYKKTCEHVTKMNGEQKVNQIQVGSTEYYDSGCTNQATSTTFTNHDAECSSGMQWECNDYDFAGGTYGPFTDTENYLTYSISADQVDYCTFMNTYTTFHMYPANCVAIGENESQKYEYVNGTGLTKYIYDDNADCAGIPSTNNIPSYLEKVPMDKCWYVDNEYTYLNDSPAETLLQVTTSALPVGGVTNPSSNDGSPIDAAGIGGIIAGCILAAIAAVLIYKAYFQPKSNTGLADHDEQAAENDEEAAELNS